MGLGCGVRPGGHPGTRLGRGGGRSHGGPGEDSVMGVHRGLRGPSDTEQRPQNVRPGSRGCLGGSKSGRLMEQGRGPEAFSAEEKEQPPEVQGGEGEGRRAPAAAHQPGGP